MDRVLDYSASGPPTNRSPLAELLLLALPTVAQHASYTVMQFIDTWMLARIGDVVATAAGQAGLLAFTIISLGFGVLLVVNTLVSQSFGRGERRECGEYLWQGLWFGLLYSLLVLPIAFRGRAIFEAFGHPGALVEPEAVYLRIVLWGAILKLSATALGQFMIGINRPGTIFVASTVGVGVNAVAALLLVQPIASARQIAEYFGIPAMGITGAAWAQNIGVGVELAVLAGYALSGSVRGYNVADWRPRLGKIWTLVRIGVPSGIQVTADVLAWSVFTMVVMAPLGTTTMAANMFVLRYWTVSFMPALGVSSAVTALAGRYIGMGRPDLVAHRTALGFRVTAVYMVLCGLLFFFGRHTLIGLFTSDPEVIAIGATVLVFAAIYQLFDALYIIYNGALRGAGDTFVPAVATAALNWTLTIGLGYLSVRFVPQWGAAGPWAAATVYGIALGSFLYARFRAGGWQRIRLD